MSARVEQGKKSKNRDRCGLKETEGDKKSTPMMVETEGKTTVISAGGTADESAKGSAVKR